MPHVLGHRPGDANWDEARGGGGGIVKYGDEYSGTSRPPGGSGGRDPGGRPATPSIYDLGLGDLFKGTKLETSWSTYLDEYDPRKEELLRKQAGIDVGQLGEAWDLRKGQLTGAWDLQQEQLGSAWDLRSTQLGEAWQQQLGGIGASYRTQTGGLGQQWQSTQAGMGAQARQGLGQINQMGQQMAQRGRGLTFGGEKQRIGKQSVMQDYERQFGSAQGAYQQAMAGATTGYKQGIGRGQLGYEQNIESGTQAYEQALAKGQLGYEQAIDTGQLGYQHGQTDIQQGLESDIFGAQSAWEQRQKDLAFQMLGMGIFSGDDWNDSQDDDYLDPSNDDY